MLQNVTDIYATPQYIAWHLCNILRVWWWVVESTSARPTLMGEKNQ